MKKIKRFLLWIIMLSLLIAGVSGCDNIASKTGGNVGAGSNALEVHFIDVGQGDSSLIMFPDGKTALIDGGGRSASDKVVSYLREQGVDKIDYLIATHPHEDHIGGLPNVVDSFDIGKVYMPNHTANTKIFESLLNSIKSKGLKITSAKGHMDIMNEGDIEFSILAPLSDSYEDTNDYSIVNKLSYGDIAILFTGDIEKSSENELQDSGYDLSADVLKIPHHGSSSSSSDEFLEAVSPSYGVIQLGEDNTYGHPHVETLNRLEKHGVEILRNDRLGDIKLVSDGKEVSFYNSSSDDESKRDSEKNVEDEKVKIIGNRNSKVYHIENCSGLPNRENRVYFDSIEEAEVAGFRPDSRCIN